MRPEELMEVITNFENALAHDRLPDFNHNKHRVEQVLRILQVDYWNFLENEEKRASNDEVRAKWEKFWENDAHVEDRKRELLRLREWINLDIDSVLDYPETEVKRLTEKEMQRREEMQRRSKK